MKQLEVELALAARAYLIIHGVEYENVGGNNIDGYCFVPVKHDGWSVLKYDQLLNGNAPQSCRDDYGELYPLKKKDGSESILRAVYCNQSAID